MPDWLPDWLKVALEKPTVSVPIAGKALGRSRNASYEAARRGEIETVRVGHRLVVPSAWLRRQLQIDTDNQTPRA
jgi:hypothetical protein